MFLTNFILLEKSVAVNYCLRLYACTSPSINFADLMDAIYVVKDNFQDMWRYVCCIYITRYTLTFAASSPCVMATELFEDIFEVRELNPEGKNFDKVTRVVGKGVSYELELTLDINSEVWRLKKNDKFTFALVCTLDLEGKPDDGIYNQSGKATLLDRYDYGMYGKIFHYEHEGGNNVAIYASFGGLLMRLRGEQRHLHLVHNDSRVYCLLRKQ
uniref:DNAdirected RNA polymerase I putative n=1 Tax=Albugo laibachii Nc14 TaxID=890382 RepID=F0W6P3_9STRA|nr:DNAdirected RNA polymerase I putative [Albugo laibachii Nc14]|eukprot:CCA16788.1 DNAdirected RNA polymerase I putative [Albugo laibachii Nc14]